MLGFRNNHVGLGLGFGFISISPLGALTQLRGHQVQAIQCTLPDQSIKGSHCMPLFTISMIKYFRHSTTLRTHPSCLLAFHEPAGFLFVPIIIKKTTSGGRSFSYKFHSFLVHVQDIDTVLVSRLITFVQSNLLLIDFIR